MTGTQSSNISSSPHDQKTEVRPVPVVFTEEESKNGQTTESRHLQDESCGQETRNERFNISSDIDVGTSSIGQAAGTAGRLLGYPDIQKQESKPTQVAATDCDYQLSSDNEVWRPKE